LAPITIGRRAFLASSAAALAACGAGDQSRPLLSADTHPTGYPTVEAVRWLGDWLAEQTNGRLRIKIYAGGQLGAERDTLEITTFGGLDLNRVNLAPLNAIEPATEVLALPFLFTGQDHLHRVLDGAPGRAVLETLEPHGLIGLCFYDSGERSFYNSRRPVNTPEDLEGLKIRVQNSDLYVAMVRALGADPTPMPFGEVYQALVQGVIDGAENNWPSYENTRHFEPAPYYSLTRHVMAPEVLVMSADRWARLTPGDRELVREGARLSVPVMRAQWAERVATAKAVLAEREVEVNEVADREAFATAMRPVWDRFMKTDLQKRLVGEIQEMATGA
jgi:tripartite ATP-independent transporter DctP family solute receptor